MSTTRAMGIGATLAAATAMFVGGRLSGLLLNTALLALGTLSISLPLGALFGVAMAKVQLPGRRLIAVAMVTLLLVPLYVQAAAWNAVLGAGGWLPQLLAHGGYVDPWLSGWRGAIWIHAMGAVPWIALMTAASLRVVERHLEEDSLLDASPWRVLGRVTIRRGKGGILAGALWVGVICATEIAVTDLFQIRTFAEEIYTQASLGGALESSRLLKGDLLVGTALITILAGLALLITCSWFPQAAAAEPAEPWQWQPRRGKWAVVALVWTLMALVILVPLAGLIWKTGVAVHQTSDHFERSWSATKAVRMVIYSPWEHRREWGWSLALASLCALATTGLAVALAWGARSRAAATRLQLAAIAVALAVPVPLWGIWAIDLFNQPADSWLAPLGKLYDQSLAVSVLVQVARTLPIALLWMSSQFASVPEELLDAARTEGAGRTARLLRIGLPLRWKAVATTGVLAFVLSITEVTSTLLVLPPGVTTVSVRIFQLLHYGVDDRVAALALSVFLLTAGGVSVWRVAQFLRR